MAWINKLNHTNNNQLILMNLSDLKFAWEMIEEKFKFIVKELLLWTFSLQK